VILAAFPSPLCEALGARGFNPDAWGWLDYSTWISPSIRGTSIRGSLIHGTSIHGSLIHRSWTRHSHCDGICLRGDSRLGQYAAQAAPIVG